MVSMVAFNVDYLSLNPAQVSNVSKKILFEIFLKKNKKRPIFEKIFKNVKFLQLVKATIQRNLL